MLIAVFSIIDQIKKIRLFKEIFLISNVNPDVVFEMLFFILNGANINFLQKKL